jgi:hypothetical protein
MAELEGEPPVVVIIDKEMRRRDELAAAFVSSARVQLAYDNGREDLITDAKKAPLPALSDALVTLRHFRDLSVAARNKTALTVYFGGNGGNDNAAPADAEYRIWRPVNAGSGILSPSEARELIEFAKQKEAGQPDAPLPNFLKNPRAVFMLPALSILCQGFLAAHALPSEEPGIRHALDHMGLPAFLESGGEDVVLIRRVVPLKRAETSAPSWWSGVLGKDKQSVESQVASEMGVALLAADSTVKALLDAVYKDDAGAVAAPVVAEAYCAIAAKLTGSPCQS